VFSSASARVLISKLSAVFWLTRARTVSDVVGMAIDEVVVVGWEAPVVLVVPCFHLAGSSAARLSEVLGDCGVVPCT